MRFTGLLASALALAAVTEASVQSRAAPDNSVDIPGHIDNLVRSFDNSHLEERAARKHHKKKCTKAKCKKAKTFGTSASNKATTSAKGDANAPVGGKVTGGVQALSGVKASADGAKAAAGGDKVTINAAPVLPSVDAKTGKSTIANIGDMLGNILGVPGPQPQAKLKQGTYLGLRSPGIFQQEWFLGIPYAKPPVGDLRFRPAVPLGPSTNTYNATSAPAACPQPSGYLITFPEKSDTTYRSEDCLTMNVYGPIGASAGNFGQLPVLLWYYGGGNIGNAHYVYNATALSLQSLLMFQPMIIITPNYRMNSLGFLAGKRIAAGEGGAVPNVGMRDITYALEWVHENIAAFGGDPNKITIAGQSSGAMSVGNQLLKDGKPGAPKPLYRAAAMLSGTSMSEPGPPADHPFNQKNYERICNAVGCPLVDKNLGCTIDCLRKVDPIKMGEATFWPSTSKPDPSQQWLRGPLFYAGTQPFQTVRDGVYQRDGASKQVGRGEFPDVPILIGNVRDEGTIFVSQSLTNDTAFTSNLRTIAFAQPDLMPQSFSSKVLSAYPNKPELGAPYHPQAPTVSRFGAGNQFERIAAVLGDSAFEAKRRYFLQKHLQYKKSPIWAYAWREYVAPPSPMDWIGITHGMDPPCWFAGFNFAPNPLWLPAGLASIQASSTLVAFVNKMNPNTPGQIFWPQYNMQDKMLREISSTPRLIKDDYRPQMSMFYEDQTVVAAAFN